MIEMLGEPVLLLVVVGAGFVMDWLAVAFQWKRIKPFSKPLAMIILALSTVIAVGFEFDTFILLLLLAEIFGLAGDIFLLLSNRWFVWGLVSFLFGHLCYISLGAMLVFDKIQQWNLMGVTWRIGLCVLLWTAILGCFYFFFGKAYEKRHCTGLMWVAIQVYLWILSGLFVMTVFLILITPITSWIMIVLPLGALLFVISDLLLACDRFLEEIPLAQLSVRMTYHLAQLGLAIGFLILK